MSRIDKIRAVLESLEYDENDSIRFNLKRFEKVDSIHVSIKPDKKSLAEIFRGFHERHGVRIVGNNFPSSSGDLSMKKMLLFLEEYDEKFNLNWCELDLKEITIKLIYIQGE